MTHFAYPNIDASGRFVGCGRYAALKDGLAPDENYRRVKQPNTPNITEIHEAALALAPTGDDIRRELCERRDVPDYPYQGASLDLAYLLALIYCKRPLKFAAAAHDFWCTGVVAYPDASPILKPVDGAKFESKLKAFLAASTPETIFFAHEANVAHLHPAVAVMSVQEVSPERVFDQKTIVTIGRGDLPLLVALLFESPPPQIILQNPYRGLFAFREVDAPFFFGREAVIDRLLRDAQTKPLIAMIGPSGCGKSSVAHAGLFPCLRRQGDWLLAAFRPGEHPFDHLAQACYSIQKPDMDELERAVKSKKAANYLLNGTLTVQDAAKTIFERHPQRRLLFCIDQFEELYTLCQHEEARRRFIDALLNACKLSQTWQQSDWQITCVLTMRADFLERAFAYRPLADALRDALFVLAPMNRDELREVIEQPARQVGLGMEEGLTERILDAVGDEPGNLPLLEFALTQLWDECGQAAPRMMTHAAYNGIGGIAQALSQYAERIYQSVPNHEQEQIKHVFMQFIRPNEPGKETRRAATRSELGEDLWRIVTKLAHARLVVTNRAGHASAQSTETAEVAHEALLRHWERLRQWIEAERHFRVWQERVRGMMQQSQAQARQGWQLVKRPYDHELVLRGKALKEAKRWLKRKRTEVSADERHFIAYCRRTLLWQSLQRIVLAVFVGIGIGVVYVILRSIFFWLTNK